jgi:hypothetical protein
MRDFLLLFLRWCISALSPGIVQGHATELSQTEATSAPRTSLPDERELQVALQYMDELGSRTLTRIVCVYELSGQVTGNLPADSSLTGIYEFGQFTRHIKTAAPLLPVPIVTSPKLKIGPDDVTHELREVKASWLVTPRGDTALVLDGTIPGDCDAQQVAKILAKTCDERGTLSADGEGLLDWLRTEATAAGLTLPEELKFGPNVHQCVFPGGRLLADIRARQSFWRIINRVAAPVEPTGQVVSFRPPELNYPGITAVGHGRGVSVMAGFSEPVENTYLLIAIMIITGLSVLHRSRANLFAAMSEASAAPTAANTPTAQTRALVASLSEQLDKLQLDLEFGVESYLDSIIIPEFMIEAFQRSLCQAMGLPAALEHSSRMLDRLASIIQARRLTLEATVQQQAERRDKIFTTSLALVTLFAVPAALLLAFLALSAKVQNGLRDYHAHAVLYAWAWGPFIVLIAGAWIARKFFKAKGQPGVRKGRNAQRVATIVRRAWRR